MALYRYRCGTHGPLDVSRPIGTAATLETCPVCREPSPRVFTSPMIGRTPRGVTSAMDQAEKSADQPDVVRSVPGGAGPVSRVAGNPAWASLPRP